MWHNMCLAMHVAQLTSRSHGAIPRYSALALPPTLSPRSGTTYVLLLLWSMCVPPNWCGTTHPHLSIFAVQAVASLLPCSPRSGPYGVSRSIVFSTALRGATYVWAFLRHHPRLALCRTIPDRFYATPCTQSLMRR